jgi:uncharacterized protein (DUF2336 family)
MTKSRSNFIPERVASATPDAGPPADITSQPYDGLLFDAAGAFCALHRPSREDAARLDELAMPLLAFASVEGKRRLAAVLSECRSVIPVQLVTALAIEPVSISASLLISRADLPDSVLEKAILVGGQDHARIIQLRGSLSASINARIDALVEQVAPNVTLAPQSEERSFDMPAANDLTAMPLVAEDMIEPPARASQTRNALRRMMMRQTVREDLPQRMVVEATGGDTLVASLINLALAGDPDMLATALSDALHLPFGDLRRIVRRNDARQVMLALKALELGATDAFAIVAALRPLAFSTVEAMATFYVGYQRISDTDISAFEVGLMNGTPGKRSA